MSRDVFALVIPERKPRIDHHAFPTASVTEVSSSDVTNKSIAQNQASKGRELSTLAPLRALWPRTLEPAWARRAVGERVKFCPRALNDGCIDKSALRHSSCLQEACVVSAEAVPGGHAWM